MDGRNAHAPPSLSSNVLYVGKNFIVLKAVLLLIHTRGIVISCNFVGTRSCARLSSSLLTIILSASGLPAEPGS